MGKLHSVLRFLLGAKYLDMRARYSHSPKGMAKVQKRCLRRNTDREMIDRSIEEFAPGVSDEEKEALSADIADCARKYLLSHAEYFAYRFREKSESERKEFMSFGQRRLFVLKANNWRKSHIFDVKTNTAKVFAPFFKREIIQATLPQDRKRLESFISKHRKVIIKPVDSSMGRGIKKFDSDNCSDFHAEVDAFIKSFYPSASKTKNVVVAEELVVQDERLGVLHPQSLNTMRVITLRTNKGTRVFQALLRVGCGDSVVDNAGAGGIICLVDLETGKIVGAANEQGISFTVHPDSKIELIGYQIPRFDEMISFAKQLSEVVPDCRYIGWDLALTKDGWIMIEGNFLCQHLSQFVTQKGCKKEFEEMAKDLGFTLDLNG